MEKLPYFDIPKENLKIAMLMVNDGLLKEIEAASSEKRFMADTEKYYTPIILPDAPDDRPYIFCSVVLSSDGKMAFVDDPKGPVIARNNRFDRDGALCDFWVLNVLRGYADAVIAGARTLHTEPGVTSTVYDNALHEQRISDLKKPEQPVTIIASFDGTDIPWEHRVWHTDPSERYKVMITTSPDGCDYILKNSPLKHIVYGPFKTKEDVDTCAFDELYKDFDVYPIVVTGANSRPDNKLSMYAFRKMGLAYACIESPSYAISLMHDRMLDEYYINYSMVFAGGTVTPGHNMPFSSEDHPHTQLVSLGMHTHSFLFSRQKIYYDVEKIADLDAYKY